MSLEIITSRVLIHGASWGFLFFRSFSCLQVVIMLEKETRTCRWEKNTKAVRLKLNLFPARHVCYWTPADNWQNLVRLTLLLHCSLWGRRTREQVMMFPSFVSHQDEPELQKDSRLVSNLKYQRSSHEAALQNHRVAAVCQTSPAWLKEVCVLS